MRSIFIQVIFHTQKRELYLLVFALFALLKQELQTSLHL